MFERIYPKGAPCSEQGCPLPIHAKGLCQFHYNHKRRALNLPQNTRQCSVCGKSPVNARDLCATHYKRFRKCKLLTTPVRKITPKNERVPFCTQEGCDRPVHARNVCRLHYEHLYFDRKTNRVRA